MRNKSATVRNKVTITVLCAEMDIPSKHCLQACLARIKKKLKYSKPLSMLYVSVQNTLYVTDLEKVCAFQFPTSFQELFKSVACKRLLVHAVSQNQHE